MTEATTSVPRIDPDYIRDNTKSFFKEHKEVLTFVALAGACYIVEKRLVTKVIRKEIAKVPLFMIVTQVPDAISTS